jgi:hypothetical protein
MAQAAKSSFGPTAVALKALHDRGFFERLLKNPKATVNDVAHELELTEADKTEVVRLIEERNKRYTLAEALEGWRKYAADGMWRTQDWPMGWTAWGR